MKETQKHIADAEKYTALIKQLNGLELPQNEQNLMQSAYLAIQNKLNPNQQTSGQPIGQIPTVKMPLHQLMGGK